MAFDESIDRAYDGFMNGLAREEVAVQQASAEVRTDGKHAVLEQKVDSGFVAVRNEMDAGFNAVRSEMDTGFKAVRAEMDAGLSAVRAEMDTGFIAVRGEMQVGFAAMRAEMERLKSELVKWIVGVTIAISATGITILTFVLNHAAPIPPVQQAAPAPIVIYLPSMPAAPGAAPPAVKPNP